MVRKLLWKKACLLTAGLLLGVSSVSQAQNAIKDSDPKNDVMFQTFGWDEYQQPRIAAAGGLYNYYLNQADYLSEAGFDMLWFPPPSQSTGGVGYLPTKLYNFSQTSWGSEAQLKAMLDKFNALQMYPIADIVVNHRNGTTGWTDFTEPEWGCEAIVYNDDGGYLQTAQYDGCRPTGGNDTGDDFSGSRDLDHTSTVVQEGVKEYLRLLKELGYKGWRWDVAKGFSAYYFGMYNQSSQPYYSVGEYWDGNADTLINWINGADQTTGAFDFALYYTFSGAFKNKSFGALNAGGRMPGLAGRSGYDDKAVTFLDNHDTFVHDTYTDDYDVEMGYAYTLTHPGIPIVFGPHYYGGTWTKDGKSRTYGDHQEAINKLIAVRKQNGINAWSEVHIYQSGSTYEAHISPSYGADATVAVKLGADLSAPLGDWIENASGNGYKVWSKKAISTPSAPAEAEITVSLIGLGISDWETDVAMVKLGDGKYRLDSYDFVGGPVKFRANADWAANWGGSQFPSGVGALDSSSNIPVVAGTYTVTFDYNTREYNFEEVAACPCEADEQQVCANGVTYANACKAQCAGATDYTVGACDTGGNTGGNTGGTHASIGLIGSGIAGTLWASDVDMTTTDGINYTLNITLIDGEVKFRQDDAWTVNWGSADFPSGTGTIDSQSNIPVTAGTYDVTFNKDTGAYTFTAAGGNTGGNTGGNNGGNTGGTHASIGLIGSAIEGTLWASDVDMTTTDGINYTLNITLIDGEVKFRQDDAWTVNWGSANFPSGTGVADSQSNIPVTAGTYDVAFNKSTGAYSFTTSSGGNTGGNNGGNTGGETYSDVGIIGSATSADTATQWTTDIDLSSSDGVTYTGTVTLLDGEAKFRQDDAWAVNWGSAAFPTGTGVADGDNIVVTAGTYDVTFNKTTGEYSFTVNNGMSLSDFNFNSDLVAVQIFPNPSSGIWNISSSQDVISVSVMDVSGKVVIETSSDVVDGTQLAPGLYYAVVSTKDSIQTIKLIKK